MLRRAKDLLSDPNRWTQEGCAIDSDGRLVRPYDLEAVAWSMAGALEKCSMNIYGRDDHWSEKIKAELYLKIGSEYSTTYFEFKPGRKHEEVMAAFDRAVAVALFEESKLVETC